MTQMAGLYNSVAPLRNVSALVELIERVNTRPLGLPGMATFYGYSGFGKTTAVVYAANKFNALQVQVKESWTGRKLGQAISIELGIEPEKTIADMLEKIAEELMRSDRPLIIDDAQYLIKRGMIGHIRDIYESSGGTIILIGEEGLPKGLQRWENIHGRMYDWVAAQPACLSDVEHLAGIYCRNLTLDGPFRDALLKASKHSIRRVCINLGRVAEFTKVRGLDVVDLAAWGNRAFFSTTAPDYRKELGL